MKKIFFMTFLGLLLLSVSAFEVHKFYMAIFQVNYVPEKKMVQITSRIFVDDLNLAIEKKYGKKVFLGSNKESSEDQQILKKYFTDNLTITINGELQPVIFLCKELDGDILVCYSKIVSVAKLHTAEITNTLLTHWNSEQQNILHFNAFGKKETFLFTPSIKTEMLKF